MAVKRFFKPDQLFACYRGDDFEYVGTRDEIMSKYGMSSRSFSFFKAPANLSRLSPDSQRPRFFIEPVDFD